MVSVQIKQKLEIKEGVEVYHFLYAQLVDGQNILYHVILDFALKWHL